MEVELELSSNLEDNSIRHDGPDKRHFRVAFEEPGGCQEEVVLMRRRCASEGDLSVQRPPTQRLAVAAGKAIELQVCGWQARDEGACAAVHTRKSDQGQQSGLAVSAIKQTAGNALHCRPGEHSWLSHAAAEAPPVPLSSSLIRNSETFRCNSGTGLCIALARPWRDGDHPQVPLWQTRSSHWEKFPYYPDYPAGDQDGGRLTCC